MLRMFDSSILYLYVLYRSGCFTECPLNCNYLVSTLFQIFQGNTNVSSVVQHDLDPVILARYIRVHPGYYTGNHVCMRLGLYGCVAKVETGL